MQAVWGTVCRPCLYKGHCVTAIQASRAFSYKKTTLFIISAVKQKVCSWRWELNSYQGAGWVYPVALWYTQHKAGLKVAQCVAILSLTIARTTRSHCAMVLQAGWSPSNVGARCSLCSCTTPCMPRCQWSSLEFEIQDGLEDKTRYLVVNRRDGRTLKINLCTQAALRVENGGRRRFWKPCGSQSSVL